MEQELLDRWDALGEHACAMDPPSGWVAEVREVRAALTEAGYVPDVSRSGWTSWVREVEVC